MVLVPLLRTRVAALAAVTAAGALLALAPIAPGSVALLGAALAGSGAGAWWEGRAPSMGTGRT